MSAAVESFTVGDLREYYIWLLGVPWALFQIYAGIRYVSILQLTYVHVLAALSMAFALNPTSKSVVGKRPAMVLDTLLTLTPIVILAYLLENVGRVMTRIPLVGDVTSPDLVFAVLTIVLLLEATRRVLGISLAVIAGVFIAYGFIGPYLPALFAHRGFDFVQMMDILFLTESSIFGTPAKVSARYVFLFVLFGAILLQSGADNNFLNLAKSVAGRRKGGAAKLAVAASALMATINGSAVANTVSTGSITIPMMSRSGYDEESSGAIEALASTGGQLMPPVMGAAAFIMADISGISYFDIIIYAIIPSVLFYVGVYTSVHFEAKKQNIGVLATEKLPAVWPSVRESIHLTIPLLGLFWALYTTRNVEYAAAVAALLAFPTVALHPSTRIGFVDYARSLKRASEMVISAAIPCAVAGIIIGTVFYTGIAARVTSIILTLTGGMFVPTLLFIAVISIVLGMGMPTSAAYVTVAVLAIPTLIQLGVPTISAHLFGLYFAVISMITPPIAIAAFAAASISEGDSWQTGIQAFQMGLSVYAIPFLFVLHPALLGIGSPLEIVGWFAIAVVVTAVISAVGVNYFVTEFTVVERVVLVVGCVVIIFVPTFLVVGIALLALGLARQVKLVMDASPS